VPAVPFIHFFGIFRLEENPSDAGYSSFHL
jgi:hypothetical protein